MSKLDLINQSYCISCNHIKILNEDYKKYNDSVFNKQFTCLKNKHKEYELYSYNTYFNNIMPSTYINKKTCYDASLNNNDKTNRNWDLLFLDITEDNNIRFNQNTRRKTKLR